MAPVLDFVALAGSCFALFFIIRAKKTYFLDSRFFIAIATVGFIGYVGVATYSDLVGQAVLVDVDTVLIGIMGTAIGMAAYLLKSSEPIRPNGIAGLKRFFSRPPIPFIGFIAAVLSWTIVSLLFPPTVQTDASGTTYYLVYPEWLGGLGIALLVSFIGLPVSFFYRQSRLVRDKTASLSMKIISVCWAFFATSVFFQIIGGGLLRLAAIQSVGFVVDSFLFVLVAFALREPTVLARIITASENVGQAIGIHPDADTIIVYNSESNRRRLIETFVGESLARGHTVVCRVTKPEVPLYRGILKSSQLGDPTIGRQDVVIRPIEVSAVFADDAETHSASSTDFRELIDLDELGPDRSKAIIENVTALDGTLEKGRNGRVWALTAEGAKAGILDLLLAKNPRSRVIDPAQEQDMFSSRLNLKHHDILGRRMLLEYKPTSNYEEVVLAFAREFLANVESVAVFTNAGSPMYREFADQRNIRLFTFSTKTSTPSRTSNDQVLLPERDTSLLLDAVDRLLQAHSGRRIGIIFEVFTYLILSLGFDKAYGVVSSLVEMVESELVTILVLVNSEALEDKTLSGIRGLFQSQLLFDSTGLKAVRLGGEEIGKAVTADSFSDGRESRRIGV